MQNAVPTGAVQHRDVIRGQLMITANAHEQRTSSPAKAQKKTFLDQCMWNKNFFYTMICTIVLF